MEVAMIGRIFNRLRVLRRGRSTWKHLWFICRCNCPKKTIREVRSDHLRRGITQSCGCLHSEISRAQGNHYKPGKRFGKLTIIAEIGRVRRRGLIYSCVCSCGKKIKVQGRHLRSGEVKSCGCWYLATRKTANFRHGKAPASRKIPVYSAYCRERSWCFNKNHKQWKYFSGRGIKFLFASFPEFYAAVGDKPGNNYWLQRRDSDGHFSAENLEWREKGRRKKKGNPVRVALDPRTVSTPAALAATC